MMITILVSKNLRMAVGVGMSMGKFLNVHDHACVTEFGDKHGHELRMARSLHAHDYICVKEFENECGYGHEHGEIWGCS